mgnify:FL=1|tara:strand:- start:77 stop:1918 length:1842 start_codon:yes stop_codon:yes gene_type:complete
MPTTTVKSTDLDFDNIKTSLKNFLKADTQFADYDFDASGLNNILDVLAYNTHVNGLTANFALNEAFLNTAQLRSSVVSHAETLGYEVRSRVASKALVELSVNLSGVTGRPAQIQLNSGTQFTSSVDGVSYTFRTLETFFARDNGSGLYQLQTNEGSNDIPIFEGTEKTKTFLVGETTERQVFVIPDTEIDTKTATVLVYDTASSTNFVQYTPLAEASTIDKDTTVFTIRETPNGFYELNFGDGISFGKKPDAGNKVIVTYLATKGPDANLADTFTPTSNVTIGGANYSITAVTSAESTGGALRQSIESVRQLAPLAFATQQRMVTSADYKAVIMSNFSAVSDTAVWSGDQNVPVDYGKVYISLNFPTGTAESTKTETQNNIVSNFTDTLGIMSIETEFVDPVDVFLELVVNFDFDPSLTGFTLTSTENSIYNFITTFFTRNLNTFDKIFRRSNLLTEIDALDPAILSSRCETKVQIRMTPVIGTNNTEVLSFPMKIATPDDINHTVESSVFTFEDKVCQIKNILSGTTLQIIDVDGNVLLDNVGEYKPADGQVEIIGFNPQAFIGGDTFIKFSVTPENQSVVKPLRNYILRFDTSRSSATATIDRQQTALKVT